MNTEMRRRLFTPIVRGLLVCLLGSSGFAAAAAITEDGVGPTDWANPQLIAVPPEGLTISGVIDGTWEVPAFDIDFFAFDATALDSPSLTIVGAMKPDCTGFPSNIALYDSAGNLLATSTSSDCPGINASISGVALQATGSYIVGISSFSHYFIDRDGVVDNPGMDTPGGDYQLVISGVRNPVPDPVPDPGPGTTPPPSVKHVPIEVRHWHQDERDLGKRHGRDPITVAILSTDEFDATTVDPKSLTFGATGDEKSLYRCRKHGKDITRDGLVDMVCYFKPDVANFQVDDRMGKLKGKAKSGPQIVEIEGSAALKIFSVPRERRGFKRRGHHDNDGDHRKNGNDKHRGDDRHKDNDKRKG